MRNASCNVERIRQPGPPHASTTDIGVRGTDMQQTTRARLARGVSLVSLAAALAAAPALAQDTARETMLDTVYVTGEKVVRNLKETASSVTVLGADDLAREKPGATDVSTAINGTPNVIYTENVGTPVIRGQDAQGPHNGANAFFAGTVPRATINLDGHYLSYNEFYFGATSAWDVDSIEVFRGPQTTTQGANAIAGAIIVNTRDPGFSPEGAYRVEAGSHRSRRASFMWSGPLSDQIAARFTLDYNARDTFIDYALPTFTQNPLGQDFKSTTARLKLLWTPTDIAGLEVKLTLAHSLSERPSQEAAADPFEDLQSLHATMPSWKQRTGTAVLDVDYDLGNGWRLFNQTQFSRSDVNRYAGIVHFGDAVVKGDNLSNELRLAFGDAESRLSGVFGLYVAKTDQKETLDQTGRYAWVDAYTSSFEDHKRNLGLFGELVWRPNDRLTVTGGLRFQRDEIRRKGYSTFSPTQVDYANTFDAVLPKLTLAYDLNDDWTVGGMISRGYNPGGVSLNFTNGDWVQFKDETITNYELFARASLLDDRLSLTANAFYMDYRDGQFNIPVLVGGVYYSYTINAEKARSYGLELGMDYKPTDALTLRASAGLLHTKLSEVSSNTAYEGNKMPKAPGRMFSLGASWDATDRLNLGGRINYVSGYYSDTSNSAVYAVDGYTTVDVTASYKLNDGFELYGYVNNLLDDRSPLAKGAARGTSVFTAASMNTPRTIGIGVRGSF